MSSRMRVRMGATLFAVAALSALTIPGASAATAATDERSLNLTRQDGSPVGTLFTDWTMVPGDLVSTTVVAHRTGGGESNLQVTLGTNSVGAAGAPTAVEEDVVITLASNGIEYSSSAAALLRGDAIVDLGRSSAAALPVEVTFELPFGSGNRTQLQSIDLSLVVIAFDREAPTSAGPFPDIGEAATVPARGAGLPNLAATGASVRDVLIAAAVATCSGLLLLARRRRRDEPVEPD